jgi:seryl-tRNA synthetase
MSRDFDNIMKEITKNGKEIHNMDSHISKDINELKRTIKSIENRVKLMDDKLNQLINIMNNITIFIGDDEDVDMEDYDSAENEDWNPYEVPYESEDSDDDDDDESELEDYNG